jgi:hypothetical protein
MSGRSPTDKILGEKVLDWGFTSEERNMFARKDNLYDGHHVTVCSTVSMAQLELLVETKGFRRRNYTRNLFLSYLEAP